MPGPFLFSSALAASALKLGGSDELNQRWLKALSEAQVIGTIAIVEEDDSLTDVKATARKSGARLVLDGVKLFVPYAHVADFVVVAARTGLDTAFFIVDAQAKGVSIRVLNSIDQTRRVCRMQLEGVEI